MKPWTKASLISVVLLGITVGGSWLRAISVTPVRSIPSARIDMVDIGKTISPTIPFTPLQDIPKEMLWFFVLYPQVSDQSKIQFKNWHSYTVEDSASEQRYVVSWTQKSRRVEIYGAYQPYTIIHLYRPGSRKIVHAQSNRIIRQWEEADTTNGWLWKNPLWNKQHLKIYNQAEFWRDSAYKRFNCARFVNQFLREAGIQVPMADAWDMAKFSWKKIDVDEIEPGDVITFKASLPSWRMWRKRVTHVGVYIGDGQFIHAATSYQNNHRGTVRVAKISDFGKRIDKIIRPPELM
jgi:hypothetical protein